MRGITELHVPRTNAPIGWRVIGAGGEGCPTRAAPGDCPSASARRCAAVDGRVGRAAWRCSSDAASLVQCKHFRLPGLVRVVAEVGVGDRLAIGVLHHERLLKRDRQAWRIRRALRGRKSSDSRRPSMPWPWMVSPLGLRLLANTNQREGGPISGNATEIPTPEVFGGRRFCFGMEKARRNWPAAGPRRI